MTAESREALRQLVAALEEHLEAVATRRGDEDAVVDEAYEAVTVAFERYEAALDTEFAETLPLVIDDNDDEDSDFDDGLDDDIEEFDLR